MRAFLALLLALMVTTATAQNLGGLPAPALDLHNSINAPPAEAITGLIADGNSHPLSERYPTLEQAQRVCPSATSLSQEIDWCMFQARIDSLATLPVQAGAPGTPGAKIRIIKGQRLKLGTTPLIANLVSLSIEGDDPQGSVILVGASPWLKFGLNNGMGIGSAVVASTGVSYDVGDLLTLTGGTCSVAPVVRVASIGPSGEILSTAIQNAGDCSVVPSNPQTYTTDGLGIDASFNATFTGTGLTSIQFVGTGSGCVNGDVVTGTGGTTPGGTPTQFQLTVNNAVGGVIQRGGTSILTTGSYGTPPPNPVSTTGTGGCTGALFNVGAFDHNGGSLTLNNLHFVADGAAVSLVEAQFNLAVTTTNFANLTSNASGSNYWDYGFKLKGVSYSYFRNINLTNNYAFINTNPGGAGFILSQQNNLIGHYEHYWDYISTFGFDGGAVQYIMAGNDTAPYQGIYLYRVICGVGTYCLRFDNDPSTPHPYGGVLIDNFWSTQTIYDISAKFVQFLTIRNSHFGSGGTRKTSLPASADLVTLERISSLHLTGNDCGMNSAAIPTIVCFRITGVSRSALISDNQISNLAKVANLTGFALDSSTEGQIEHSNFFGLNLTPVVNSAAAGKNLLSYGNTPGHFTAWGGGSTTVPTAFPSGDAGPNPVATGWGGNRWYATPAITPINATPTASRLYAAPIYIPTRSTVRNIGFNVQAASAGNWQARMGIYTNLEGEGQEARPGDLVANSDTGNLSYTSATTGGQSTTINGSDGVVLTPGWYWLAWTFDNGSDPKTTNAAAQTGWLSGIVMGAASPGTAVTGTSPTVYTTFSYTGSESLPASFGAAQYNGFGPIMAITGQAP